MEHNRVDQEATLEEIVAALTRPQWQVRAVAIQLLARFGEQTPIHLLAKALTDEHRAVRVAALETLAALAPRAPVVLAEAALVDPDWSVRAAAAWALGHFGDRAPLERLVAIVDDKAEDALVRASALHALGALGERVPVERIVQALNDPEWHVREVAALALGRQGDLAPIGPLAAALKDENAFVRAAVIDTLRHLQGRVPKNILVAALNDEDESVRQAATRALKELGGEESSRGPPPNYSTSVAWPEMERGPKHSLLEAVHRTESIQGRSRSSDIRRVGNIEFKTLEPADFRSAPVVAQALDNQWLPRSALRLIMTGKLAYAEVEEYLERLVRTEYARALINGRQVVINRAYLYNNPALFRDYLPGRQSRDAIKELLNSGVIVPFLSIETAPDEPPSHGTHPQGFPAWQQLCQEVRMHCLRFDWNDGERNRQKARMRLARRFHNFALEAETGDIGTYVRDLALNLGTERPLRKRLFDMAKACTTARSRGKDRFLTRNDLYRLFVTEGDNPAERRYDPSKPFAGEIKQLLDLAYNSFLADALNGYLLTPNDSLPRLALQEWSSVPGGVEEVTAEQLMLFLRRDVCPPVQGGPYLEFLSLLALQDVLTLRETDEWAAYIGHVEALLQRPAEFVELASNIYRSYAALALVMTKFARRRNVPGYMLAVRAPCAELVIDVAGAILSILWTEEGPRYTFSGEQEPRETPNGTAPVSARLNVREWQRTHGSADLFTSLEFMRGSMQSAQQQWRVIRSRLSGAEGFSEGESNSTSAQATLNSLHQNHEEEGLL